MEFLFSKNALPDRKRQSGRKRKAEPYAERDEAVKIVWKTTYQDVSMAQVTEINIKGKKSSAPKGRLKKEKKNREFSARDRLLIGATSLVAFGGVVFCTVMIILMTSIDY